MSNEDHNNSNDEVEKDNNKFFKVKKIVRSKAFLISIILLIVGLIIGGSMFSGAEEISILKEEISILKETEDDNKKLLSERNNTIEELEGKMEKQDKKIEELQAKVDSAAPWFEMEEEERKAEEERLEEEKAKKEAEEQAKREEEERKAEEERIAKEKKAEEERIEKEKAEREAETKKYQTGITYEDLARYPIENMGNLVSFKGKILQVMSGTSENQYRMAIDSNYDEVVLLVVDKSKLADGNILEDDIITIEGTFLMEMEYTTVMGATRNIPAIIVDNLVR